ncbi:MAG TPA: signal peptidase II [Bryobacteraceae bacterium]|nr:signal peptidase II [Bryobacteraceae bacterium]
MSVRARSAAIIAALVLVDRATKWIIRTRVSGFDIIPVIPGFFNIVHTENPGAAFGFLSDTTFPWRRLLLVGISVAVMAIIGWMLWRAPASDPHMSALMRTGLALVFGGALGNLWDRALVGTVTDFLQFFFGSYEFPSFNAADSAITIGAGLLLLDLWRTRGREMTGKQSSARPEPTQGRKDA